MSRTSVVLGLTLSALFIVVGLACVPPNVVIRGPRPPAVAVQAEAAPAPGARVAVTPAPAPAPAGMHVIRFHRPVQVGYREKIVRVAESRRTKNTRLNGQVTKQEVQQRRVELAADVTVLAVDQRGRPVRSQYNVHKCTAQTNTGKRILVAPGSVMVVQRGDPAQITVNQQPAGADIVELLDLVMSTSTPRPIVDDDVFGTSQPQPVGGSWAVNSQVAVQGLASTGIQIPLNLFQGRVTFQGIEAPGGTESARLIVEMRASGFQMANLPPGAQISEGAMESRSIELLPFDLAQRSRGGENVLRVRTVISMPEVNPALTLEMLMEQRQQGTATRL